MTTYRPWRAKALLGLVGLALTGMAQAACTLETPTVVLAPYNALGPAPNPTNVSFSLACTENAVVKIQASAGNSANLLGRQLRQGSNAIAYNLYVGSTGTTIWGNGTSNTGVVTANVGANGSVQVVGNVRVPGSQNPLPGMYSDVLMFTFIY